MKWQLMSFVVLTSCAVGTVVDSEAVVQQELDTSTYGFEDSKQGWEGPGAAVSGARVYAGTRSLTLTFSGLAGVYEASVADPAFTSGRITAHLWVPYGAAINSVQLF